MTVSTGKPPHPQAKYVRGINRFVRFVPRENLRRKKVRKHFNAAALRLQGFKLPTPPGVVDWSLGGKLTFPIDGNDQYGDCEYAAACHGANTFTGCVSTECSFDENAVIQAYLALSGGDNGLDTDTMMGAWKAGLVSGPHKILDDMPVTAGDTVSMKLAAWLFGGLFFTLGIPAPWLNSADPGDVWDAGPGIRADDNNGHAVWITGIEANGNYDVQTWALAPCIQMTPAGVNVCDPEASVVFSLDWFNSSGIAPNGLSYDQLAALWVQLGGNALPPSPFPPSPTPVPVPPGPTPIPPPPGPSPLPGQLTGSFAITLDQTGPVNTLNAATLNLQQLLALIEAILAAIQPLVPSK